MKKNIIALVFVLSFSLALFAPKVSQARNSFSLSVGIPAYEYVEPVYVPTRPVYVVRHRHHPHYVTYYEDDYDYTYDYPATGGVYFNYSNYGHRGYGHHHHHGW